MLFSACKKQTTTTTKTGTSLEGIYLEFSQQGLQVKIGGQVPQQKFYRLRFKKLKFNNEQVTARIESSEAITFAEVMFAFQYNGNMLTCFLEDVSAKITIIDPKSHCESQPEGEDYFRQFVEWCEDDNESERSPWTGNWKSTFSCKRLTHTDIPAFCFTDKANACFSMLSDEVREGRSQLTNYLQNNHSQKFVDILETLDNELKLCHPFVVRDISAKKIYCKCGEATTKTLGRNTRQCSRDPESNVHVGFKHHYHLLDSYYLSPTGPYREGSNN